MKAVRNYHVKAYVKDAVLYYAKHDPESFKDSWDDAWKECEGTQEIPPSDASLCCFWLVTNELGHRLKDRGEAVLSLPIFETLIWVKTSLFPHNEDPVLLEILSDPYMIGIAS